jgi:predicted  nucleic acid-binding Zn-ribbon protein
MIDKRLIQNKVSEATNVYKKNIEKITTLITDKYELERINDAYVSLSFFSKLACDILESKRKFLATNEIGKLESFITSLTEPRDIVRDKKTGAYLSLGNMPHSELVYYQAIKIADEVDIIKPIIRVFHFGKINSERNHTGADEIKTLISKFKENQNSLTSVLAMLDEKLEATSQIIGTATAKLKDINKHQENLEKEDGKYQSTLSMLSFQSESLTQKKNDLAAAHDLLDNVRTMYEDNDKSLKELNKEFSELKVSVSSMKARTLTIEDELNQKTADIDSIITQANAALETSTTVSVGGFFKDQYDIAKKGIFIWPILALLFLGGAILICFDTLKYMRPGVLEAGTELSYLIARFCIAPLFLLGAWFCTNQYIKQKNITEDYAYKKVLSLSLIGFKSEIEKTGEANTTGFIKSLLKEILRSPLETLDKKHYKRETKLLKLAHDEMIANMFKNVTSKNNEPDADKK